MLLDENDVIKYLIKYLVEKQDYHKIDYCDTSKHGYDIILKKNGRKLYIEAKGGTSSKESTNRFKKPFTHAQKKNHVAMAIFKSLQTKSDTINSDVAIALPSDDTHKRLIDSVYKQLKELDISIYFVKNSNEVKKV